MTDSATVESVFIVTEGEYDDYRIVEVFPSPALAEAFIGAVRNAPGMIDPLGKPRVEEWPLRRRIPDFGSWVCYRRESGALIRGYPQRVIEAQPDWCDALPKRLSPHDRPEAYLQEPNEPWRFGAIGRTKEEAKEASRRYWEESRVESASEGGSPR